ncbi:hypothetical protein [Myxococcus sp. Y35]|uniref:hypothetical protein n=1 Tax=Pseudomyxococcus flavus TaxID=3115648 RepID=UPI003CF5F333
MEITLGFAALWAVWWAWRAMRTKRFQRAMDLRRMTIHKRQDVFADTWEFDFVEMALLYEYRVFDWPPVESNSLYALRRCGDSHWEVQLMWESAEDRLREIDRDAKSSLPMSEDEVSRLRASIRKQRDGWRQLDDHMAAQLDTHYKLFLASYEPVTPDFRLEDLWRRMTALKREREARETLRQERAV